MERVTFGIIALNAQPFLEYNLRALYPFAHQIIVVEGAITAAESLATPAGHSTDDTLEMLMRFKAEDDPDDKLEIITAEDEGHTNGFWDEKNEMSRAYAQRAGGDWLWQIDADEFYLPEDMQTVLQMLASERDITAVSFPYHEFWGGFDFVTVGQYHLYIQPEVHRLFKWSSDYHYLDHRPPTVIDETGRDLRTLRWVTHKQMRSAGIFMYHYSYVLPKQAQQKVGYYANVTWTSDFQQNQRWYEDSFLGLKSPFFVSEKGRKAPQWLEPFTKQHPTQIARLRENLNEGKIRDVLRPTDDIEKLIHSPIYMLGRMALRVYVALYWRVRCLIKPLTSAVRTRITSMRTNKVAQETQRQ